MADHSVLDKSMRSVFVGNIPYEATEEKLKDIFSEVGPVLSFKLVYDRETGKPKGYGFCEYQDQETALSAMRNLNCYEIGGRTLRVDNACTEKSRLEMQSLMMGMPTSENHYGNAISPEKAPEAISNIVSALPPEQLYDLMKQMKDCVQNNPIEARNMLLQNPQLSYALLQAQVVMKIVDPEVAQTMLHSTQQVNLQQMHNINTSSAQPLSQIHNGNIQWRKLNPQATVTHSQPDNLNWHHMKGASNQLPIFPPPSMVNESPRPYLGYPMNMDNRSFMDSRPNNGFIPILPQMSIPPPTLIRHPLPQESPLMCQPLAQQSLTNDGDYEKAALIKQVLLLTDEQISVLSIDQQQKIIELKEKFAPSSQQNE